MQRFLNLCSVVRTELATIHPLAPWAAISLGLWLAVYAVRRWFPAIWLTLEQAVPPELGKPASNVLMALPIVAFGAAFAALTTNEEAVAMAFWGAVSASVAPIVHHLLKASKLPYEGPVRDAIWKQAKAAAKKIFPVTLLLIATGCAVPLERARRDGPVMGASRVIPARCESLDDARTTWGAVAKGAAVVAGASGISAVPLETEEGQIAVASVGAAAAVVGAVAVYVAEQKGEAWARECSR